ncbi:MAG: methyltransferase, partial [Thalassobaculaceae bacterium]
NPPYLTAARGTPSPSPRRRASDVEMGATLADWVDAARRLLVHKGRLTMIHRADRVAEICALMRADFGDLTICPLWPRAGAAANRVIVRGRKGSRGPDVISPGWVLHGADNRFRAATVRLLAGGGFDPATGLACE